MAARNRATKAIALVFGLSVLAPFAALQATPTLAAEDDSCTGWQSTRIPPDTIRVLRKATGVVEVVPFQTYVVTVMGKEWPGYLPLAVIEAGSVAVKEYAWYHTMAGRHRKGYVNAAGECYDVRDTTGDQLYKPEKARIRNKHWDAIDVTWNYHVRKDGRQFLTSYRTGKKGPCGNDATGWKIFARSAVRCAEELGYNWMQILHTYYGPDLHIVDRDGNIVDDQGNSIGQASVIGSAQTPGSGPKTYDERHDSIEWNGAWKKTQSDTAHKDTLTLSLERGASLVFDIKARSFKLLGRTGPKRGRIKVFVDGTLRATVDTYSAQRKPQQVFFEATWETDTVRRIRIELDGPAERPRVDIDAIVVER